jgi:hypothetical protein
MTLTAGTQLGAYEIISLVGAGGMDEVYKGGPALPAKETTTANR